MRLSYSRLLILLGTSCAALATASAGTQYSVFCANDRIEIDSRSLEQMKSARGSNLCLLGSFDYRSDAQSFAKKNFGGAGASCSCR